MANSSNDNDTDIGRAAQTPDLHGQAALLLVESLIHALVDRSVLRIEDAIEVIDVAVEVRRESGIDSGDTAETLRTSIRMLATLGESLRRDLPRH